MRRNSSLDYLKLSMALMVVALHANFLGNEGLVNYLAVNGIFRIAVPVFLIINGFYFYPVLIENNEWTWFRRIGVLYLLWMGFYSYFWAGIGDFSIISILELISRFVIGYTHLWYISGLIGAALVVVLIKKISARWSICILAFTFLFGVIIQYVGIYHLSTNLAIDEFSNYLPAHRNFLLFSFPFFYVGFLIRKYSLCESGFSDNIPLFVLIGLVLLILESYLNYQGLYPHRSVDNLASLILFCPALFIYFQKIVIWGNSKSIALYSSAIYFIHVFIISVLVKIFHISGLLLTCSTMVLSILASFVIVRLSKRFPYII